MLHEDNKIHLEEPEKLGIDLSNRQYGIFTKDGAMQYELVQLFSEPLRIRGFADTDREVDDMSKEKRIMNAGDVNLKNTTANSMILMRILLRDIVQRRDNN